MADSATFRARSTWSAPAKRTFRDIAEAHPAMDKAKLSGLYAACDLFSAADKLQLQIDEDGLMVAGSMGQKVAHPLISEVRQYRKAATDALRALGLDGRSASSAAGSALATKRWSSAPAAGATVTPIGAARSAAPF
ncbi:MULTISPECIES: P27 family phage terminase small subunit [unclassified Microbacterium]|uniref:P27 family phage terminase small subunit n=1 Tax=unclassified Microbacterium TaxID=2609290 RepID=UPI0003FB0040|nr:P27 family phage terminase small subunit [Microbacterium sp. B24]